jgi:structural maintenance of chromosome 2
MEIHIEGKKLNNEIKHLGLEKKECPSKVDRLFEKHEWIATLE